MKITDQDRYDACSVCSSPNIKPWRRKEVANVTWKIDRCNSCGFAFVNPKPSDDFLMDYYSSHGLVRLVNSLGHSLDLREILEQEYAFPNATVDAKRIISTMKNLKPGDNPPKFLDVGCGYGFFSKEALQAGFDVTAIEIAETDRKIAQEMLGMLPLSGAFEDFDYTPGSFDFVLMSQTLEHALDVNLWVEKARDCLVDGGVLTVAVPNFGSIFRLILQEKEPFIAPPEHLNYFNVNSLSRLLKKHGFKVESKQYASRIPSSAFESRLPNLGGLLPAINTLSRLSLGAIDALRLGMIINVYGRKLG